MIEVVRDVDGITWTVWKNKKVHGAYTNIDLAFSMGVRELLSRDGVLADGDVVRIVDHNGLSNRIDRDEKPWEEW